MVAAMSLWIAVTVLGWALVYLPALPDDFVVASGVDVSRDDLLDALYYSGVTQTTLGFGDITPDRGLLRLLAPVQATLGFGLLTMVATWVLSVYPALHRQRQAASLAHVIRCAHERRDEALPDIHPTVAARRLERLSAMLSEVRMDFTQYPSTFYFAAPDATASLAEDLPFIDGLSRAEDLDDEPRAAAAELAASIELFAGTLATQHLDMPDADARDVLRAFRRHHGLEDAAAPTGW